MKTFLLTLLIPFSILAESATVSWDANKESDLAGYKIYYGQTSGSYDDEIDVGNDISWVVDNLTVSATYFFVATAYDFSGNESMFSNEVNITITEDNRAPEIWNIVFGDRNREEEIILEIVAYGDETASGNGWTIWGYGRNTDSGLYILNPSRFIVRIVFDVKLIGSGSCIEQSRMLDVSGNPWLVNTSWQEVEITLNLDRIFINYSDDCFIEDESDANIRIENMRIFK